MQYVWLLLAVAEGGEHAPEHHEQYIGPIEEIARGFLPESFFVTHTDMLDLNFWQITVLLVPFAITLFVLSRFLFRPMTRVMEERERRTVGFRQEAEELEEKFKVDLEKFEAHMAGARKDASEARATIRREATLESDRILGEARAEVSKTLEGIREEIASERKAAAADLQQRASELAGELAAKVLGRPVAATGRQPQEGA